jgi:hypothetical protein
VNGIGRIGRLAVGDFLDRIRRPVYVVTLLAAVGLGYLALPSPQTHWTVLDLDGYRGVYNSAYVGTATALTGTLYLTLGGFYVVRNTIGRDETTGVGELLAATSLRTPQYLAAKLAGNFLVLASVAGVLAGTALVLQLARGESRAVQPVALLLPFFVLTVPMLVVTAALAVMFDSVPQWRGGLGNVVWFVLALIIAIAGQSATAPLDGLGARPVFDSLRETIEQHHPLNSHGEFSFGFTYRDFPFQTVDWSGFHPSSGFLLNRLLLMLLATALALLPAFWFARFDPDRRLSRSKRRASAVTDDSTRSVPGYVPTPPAALTWMAGAEPVSRHMQTAELAPARASAAVPPPRQFWYRRAGATFGRLVSGELRILVQGVSPWWWLVAVGLTIVATVVPQSALPGMLLLIWVWPVLIWSRLGSQRVEQDLEEMLRAYPRPRRRVLAEWSAGVVLTTVLASGPGLRMVAGGDRPGIAAWVGGVLFVPSVALLLGLISRSHRLFQALYLPLWFLMVNGVAAVDYLGAVRSQGRPAGPPATLIVSVALVLLFAAVIVDTMRERGRIRLTGRSWPLRRLPRDREGHGARI